MPLLTFSIFPIDISQRAGRNNKKIIDVVNVESTTFIQGHLMPQTPQSWGELKVEHTQH